MKNKIIISDVTLRDGNHAVNHSIDLKTVQSHCYVCEKANIDIVEVGHGNGLGASSLSIGRSRIEDKLLLKTARKILKKSKLSIHSIPGFSKISDLIMAIDMGVDIFRIGCNSTEIDTTKKQISICKKNKVEVWGVLMMFHLVLERKQYFKKIEFLIDQGVDAIIIMDSAGCLDTQNVRTIFTKIKSKYKKIRLGFHAHNNLGMAISNSIQSLVSGAEILDASLRGFGAGAGNAQLEILITLLQKTNKKLKIDLDLLYSHASNFPKYFQKNNLYKNPFSNPENIMSANYGVFSGFASKVDYFCEIYKLNKINAFKAIAAKKLVAGQEDLIMNVLHNLNKSKK